MTIVSAVPFNLQNGTTADATQVMADFNSIKNDVNTNAAHNGANNDITSLAGLTTPLSIAQGGTGQITFPTTNNRNIMRRNGGLEIWQRGGILGSSIAVAASSTSGVYTADGWYLLTNANQASQVIAAGGLGNVAGMAGKVQRNSGQIGTGVMRFGFPLDYLDTGSPTAGLYNQEVVLCRNALLVLTFRAKAGANWSPASGALNYNLYFGTGVGGASKRLASAYTGETNPITGTVNLTTTDTLYTAYSSVAVGTTITQGELQFSWTPVGTAGVDDSFTVDDVQIAIIPSSSYAAPPFEKLTFLEMLLLCQAHYCKSFDYTFTPAQNAGTGTGEIIFIAGKAGATAGSARIPVRFPVQMRASPTATTFNPAAANAQVRDEVAAADMSSTVASDVSNGGMRINATGNASTAVGNIIAVHYTADASI